MKALLELIAKGGPAMYAIIGLSIILYSRCFLLLVTLCRSHRQIRPDLRPQPEHIPSLRRLQGEVQESFRQQRVALGAMIAAAPLLGLLGTVSGMVRTFENISAQSGQKSMEGLAGGISEVLVATESGLAVAIPALLIVYSVHWGVRRLVQKLGRLEENLPARSAP